MSTATATAAQTPTPVSGSADPAIAAKRELGVSLVLNNWKALSDAVAAQWGGPDSADKRDWLCGAVADMFVDRPDTDEYDLEETLLHVMDDEFEVNVEDDSAYEIAAKAMALRKEVLVGNFATVDALHARFLENDKAKATGAPAVREVIDEAGSSASDMSDEEADSDTEMGEAPPSAPSRPKEHLEPVIDEDGFELVQKKGGKKR